VVTGSEPQPSDERVERHARASAPVELELVRDLANTIELDEDPLVDRIADPAALAAWLEARGLGGGPALAERDVARAREFRGALRSLLHANAGAPRDDDAVARLTAAGDKAPLRVRLDAEGAARLEPAAAGVSGLIAAALAAIARAQDAGTWERLKICAADDCQWAFYDRSRNRSRAWCSMEVCGNRAKARAYRERSASASESRRSGSSKSSPKSSRNRATR
jgi:predicted RNA-binding Zn ribbon-like protein